MTLSAVISVALLASGCFFLVVSSIGLLRMPDFLTRTHAVGKSDTLGSLLILTGLAVHSGVALNSVKLLLIVGLIAVTNPAGIHTLTRAALGTRRGMPTDGALGTAISDPGERMEGNAVAPRAGTGEDT